MDRKTLTSRQYFKLLSLIYGVMLLAQVGTGTVLFLLRNTQVEVTPNHEMLSQALMYIGPFLAFMLPFMGWAISKQTLKTISSKESLSEKLRKYQSNLLLKYAFFEAPTLVSAFGYFLTGNIWFLGAGIGLVLFFLTQAPSKKRLLKTLPFSPIEEAKLNNPEAEVTELPIKD